MKTTIPIDQYFCIDIEEYEQYTTDTKNIEYIIINGTIQYHSHLIDSFLLLTGGAGDNLSSIINKEDIELFRTTMINLPKLGEFRYKVYSTEYTMVYNDNLNHLPLPLPSHRTDDCCSSRTNMSTLIPSSHASNPQYDHPFTYGSVIERIYNYVTEEYTRIEQYRIESLMKKLITTPVVQNGGSPPPTTSLESNTATSLSSPVVASLLSPSFKGLAVRALSIYLRSTKEVSIEESSSNSTNTYNTRMTHLRKMNNNNNILILVQGSGRRTDEVSNSTQRLMAYYSTVLGLEEIWPKYRSYFLPVRYIQKPSTNATETTRTGGLVEVLHSMPVRTERSEDEDNTLSETVPMWTTVEKIVALHYS